MMSPTTLKKSKISSGAKAINIIKRKTPKTASLASLNQSVQFAMSPKPRKKSQLLPFKSSTKTLKGAKLPLYAMSPKALQPAKDQAIQTPLRASKLVKIILVTKSGFYESPKRGNVIGRKRKQVLDEEEDEEHDDADYEPPEDEEPESPIRRTRSEQPDLYNPLTAPTHHRRPKVYPALTPWLDYWNMRNLNDLNPDGKFKWNNSDVPDFDLGEPLDETNFWEQPWIAANEEKKRVRNERQRKYKKQRRYGGLKAAGRKRAYKKRGGVVMKRENGRFVKSEAE